MLLTFTALTVLGVGVAFADSFALFVVLRFLRAFFDISVYTTVFVYCELCVKLRCMSIKQIFQIAGLEMVGGKWRVIAGLCLEFPCALGFTTLPAMAYLLPNWTHLQLAITLPTLGRKPNN